MFTWVPAYAPWIDATLVPPPAPAPPAPPPAPADTTAPVIRHAKLSAKRLRAARRGATIARAGARLSFTLSEPAAVRITVLKGRRALSPAPTLAAPAGRTTRRFNARVGGRQLDPGAYRLRIGAVDAAGNVARPVALAFKVRR